MLIPLKINKKKIIKNTHILNDISNIEKPKNNKKYFITNQVLSEADFRDYPYKIKKIENNKSIDKKNETESKDESDDNDLNNRDNDIEKTIKRNFILQNIDLDKFTGSERKIIFNAPPKTKDTSYGKTIWSRRKAIFENKE